MLEGGSEVGNVNNEIKKSCEKQCLQMPNGETIEKCG